MRIEKTPAKGMNGLYSIKIVDETSGDRKMKSFSEIIKILSKPVNVYRGRKYQIQTKNRHNADIIKP